MPREVRQGNESENIQWEKADIYSVAKIMVYCKDPAEVKVKLMRILFTIVFLRKLEIC